MGSGQLGLQGETFTRGRGEYLKINKKVTVPQQLHRGKYATELTISSTSYVREVEAIKMNKPGSRRQGKANGYPQTFPT